jgi:hypothetical protein
MICPVELASDVSALRAARVGDHVKHGFLPEGCDGAGDQSTRSNFAGHGQEDPLVASGGDHRHQRPADAALARALCKGTTLKPDISRATKTEHLHLLRTGRKSGDVKLLV